MNIVFDLGGVIFRWDPEALAAAHFPGREERGLALRLICGHGDWIELDRGALTYDEAARRAGSRTGIEVNRIRRFLDGTAEHLIPKEDSVGLLRELGAAGHPLYLLSNMHGPVVPCLERHDFMRFFKGKIYSCQVGQVKPEGGIYRTLLKTFSLEARDTVFIDDTPSNLPEAEAQGIHTIHFTGAARCRRELAALDL